MGCCSSAETQWVSAFLSMRKSYGSSQGIQIQVTQDSVQHHLDVPAVTFTGDQPYRTSLAASQVGIAVETAQEPRRIACVDALKAGRDDLFDLLHRSQLMRCANCRFYTSI